MQEKTHKLIWIMSAVLLAVYTIVTFMTHRVVPFMMDDLWYATMLYDENIPIISLADIVESQIWHYNNWGGRSMTHGILQLTLLAGEMAADVLNVVFTLLLAGMICFVSENRSLPAFFAASGMLLGLNANWRMSMFWQAGAANYLYITVFLLAYAYCYLRELPEDGGGLSGQAKPDLPGIGIWILPLGILAGWSNENMGPAVWVMSLVILFLIRKEKRKPKFWMVTGNLACLAGCVLCIAAPGNFVRAGQTGEEGYGILWRIFLRCYGEGKALMEYLFPALLVLAGLLLLSRCLLKQALNRRELLLLFTALLSWGAMILSPHYPDRASFGTMVLCVCVSLSLAKKIIRQRADLAVPLWGGALLIWLRGMYFCGEWLSLVWGWIK